VHLAVVDPGVGSDRAAIAVESDGRFLVGPDNGLLSPALLMPGARIVRIPVPANATPTFHGRDVFAPVAARLAAGEPLSAVGMPFPDPMTTRTVPVRVMEDGGIEGEVIAIDRFGNAITNLVSRPRAQVEVGSRRLAVVRTYADVPTGSLCALAGSTGLIEIAVRDGNGALAAGLRRGSKVILSVRA
jgi:S-adenosylmethionine hydrolase